MDKAAIVPVSAANLPPWDEVRTACTRSPLGKRLPDALYIHISALSHLDLTLQAVETIAHQHLPPDFQATLIKFNLTRSQISYLDYPNFDQDPHPALHTSLQVNLTTGIVQKRDYSQTPNPPILHRKETFVTDTYPLVNKFAELTRQEELIGLLKQSRHIGTRCNWQYRLQEERIEIHDHVLACPLITATIAEISPTKPQIDRHRAALPRKTISKPVRLALEAGLLPSGTLFFDYGCGQGGDVERLAKMGCVAEGWDPHYRSHAPWIKADVVNLGYVINVIEDPAERRETLVKAWELTQKVLIVAAQVLVENGSYGIFSYEDGIITRRNTFQKYYEQEELKAYIDQVLGVDAIPIALGIYLVFRDTAQGENFRASRFRSRATTPRIRIHINQFEEHRDRLQPLMDFYTDRGRLPNAEEVADQEAFQSLITTFKTVKQAFQIILKATSVSEWDAISDKRRQDLLVYLALSRFEQRPRFSDLSSLTQGDIKGLFGSYAQSCAAADLMLLSVGNLVTIRECCHRCSWGQRHSDSLWVHVSLLEYLDPLLRLYEGCASRTIGRPAEATLIKFQWTHPSITYFTVPEFDRDPYPALSTSMKINLQEGKVYYRDYDRSDNPPVLHRKEQLVDATYADYEKFAKLSRQELKWGICDEQKNKLYDRESWQKRLANYGAELQGHRLIWRKDIDPYQRKLLKSQQRSRASQGSNLN